MIPHDTGSLDLFFVPLWVSHVNVIAIALTHRDHLILLVYVKNVWLTAMSLSFCVSKLDSARWDVYQHSSSTNIGIALKLPAPQNISNLFWALL